MSGDDTAEVTIDAEAVYAAFGDQLPHRARGLAATKKLAAGISELIPLMDGNDGGGQLRVASMLLGIGQALAASAIAKEDGR